MGSLVNRRGAFFICQYSRNVTLISKSVTSNVHKLRFTPLKTRFCTKMDDISATEFLASMPEVDAQRIGCTGWSMGGYRAWMLSALSDRVKVGAARDE